MNQYWYLSLIFTIKVLLIGSGADASIDLSWGKRSPQSAHLKLDATTRIHPQELVVFAELLDGPSRNVLWNTDVMISVLNSNRDGSTLVEDDVLDELFGRDSRFVRRARREFGPVIRQLLEVEDLIDASDEFSLEEFKKLEALEKSIRRKLDRFRTMAARDPEVVRHSEAEDFRAVARPLNDFDFAVTLRFAALKKKFLAEKIKKVSPRDLVPSRDMGDETKNFREVRYRLSHQIYSLDDAPHEVGKVFEFSDGMVVEVFSKHSDLPRNNLLREVVRGRTLRPGEVVGLMREQESRQVLALIYKDVLVTDGRLERFFDVLRRPDYFQRETNLMGIARHKYYRSAFGRDWLRLRYLSRRNIYAGLAATIAAGVSAAWYISQEEEGEASVTKGELPID